MEEGVGSQKPGFAPYPFAAAGATKFARLVKCLLADNRRNELGQVTKDEDLREQLYDQYNRFVPDTEIQREIEDYHQPPILKPFLKYAATVFQILKCLPL